MTNTFPEYLYSDKIGCLIHVMYNLLKYLASFRGLRSALVHGQHSQMWQEPWLLNLNGSSIFDSLGLIPKHIQSHQFRSLPWNGAPIRYIHLDSMKRPTPHTSTRGPFFFWRLLGYYMGRERTPTISQRSPRDLRPHSWVRSQENHETTGETKDNWSHSLRGRKVCHRATGVRWHCSILFQWVTSQWLVENLPRTNLPTKSSLLFEL